MLQSRREDPQEGKPPKPQLGRKLALTLLPLVLLPMVGLGTAAYLRTQSILRQETLGQMRFALRSQVNALEEWYLQTEGDLTRISLDPTIGQTLKQLVENADDPGLRDTLRENLQAQLTDEAGEETREFLILNQLDGQILLSTTENISDGVLQLPGNMEPGIVVSIPLIDHPAISPQSTAILLVTPLSSGNIAIGLLLPESEIADLLQSLERYWPPVDEQGNPKGRTLLLIPPETGIQTSPIEGTIEISASGEHPAFSEERTFEVRSSSYDSAPGTEELTSFRWIEEPSLGIAVERPQADILAGLINIAPFLGLLIFLAVLLTFLVIILVTNRIFQPLTNLAEFAKRMSSGEWHFRVPEDRDEELGGLASSLNRMAAELGQLYQSLEERVEDRTQQIQTASEVARAVISIPDLDELLRQAAELIKSRFGYDHVSIFLLDRKGSNAILRESSSGEVEDLKTLGHKLKVGSKSVVGVVTETSEPRISTKFLSSGEVELDELLPGAQSEAAIPLRVAGNTLGALAIQSLQPNAFKKEDIEVLQTLADQLSAAIENVRLAQESTNAAERARLVSEITSQISGLMDPGQVLQATAQALHKALGEAEIRIRLATPEEDGHQVGE